MTQENTYNPLDKRNLGYSVTEALLERPAVALPPEPFEGAGIYALYYAGAYGAYAALARKNAKGRLASPIYVGKAIPEGARKGGFGLDAVAGNVLHKRLREHARSIEEASNLDLGDFRCRYLVTDDIWIPLGESLLIEMFSPLWNMVVDGFGNHDPGSGRYNQQRSPWDVLHPGRAWAEKCQPCAKSEAKILKSIREFLRT